MYCPPEEVRRIVVVLVTKPHDARVSVATFRCRGIVKRQIISLGASCRSADRCGSERIAGVVMFPWYQTDLSCFEFLLSALAFKIIAKMVAALWPHCRFDAVNRNN